MAIGLVPMVERMTLMILWYICGLKSLFMFVDQLPKLFQNEFFQLQRGSGDDIG